MTVHTEGAQGLLFPRLVQELGERIGRRASFGRGETLFAAGDKVGGLHLVVAGQVRIVRASSGRSIVVHHEKAGGVLGEVALFGAGVYPATAVASEPTDTLMLPAQPLRRAIANDAALADFFLGRLARRAQEIIARLDRLAHHTVLRRLAAHLVARRAATRGSAGVISLGMTLPELAEELGTVKEVIVRELRVLRRLQLIAPAGRGLYRVVDARALTALASDSDLMALRS